MFQLWKQKIQEFHHKYESRLEIAFFIIGFAFDALMATEVDDLFGILQQTLYLFIIASLLHYEILYRLHKWRPLGRMVKLWSYRTLLLHFLLGGLLNVYSIFYIKSASFLSSLVFLAIMVVMVFANELPMVKKSKVSLKFGLFAICLFSYISILYPLLLGFVGWIPFGLSVATTLALYFLQLKWLKRSLPDDKTLLKAMVLPGFSVLLVFVFFYWMGWIPPVPLSAKVQGVYHFIEKKDGEYLLSTEKIWWKFWQTGDEDFAAEPGDKIYFYTQIYSPARFADQIYVRWLYKDPKGNWQPSDRIPIKIVGGRKEGFRGYAIKSNYQEGPWRIQVETATGQEISRMYFDVTAVPKNQIRNFQILKR